LRHPEYAGLIQQVLAIPQKRFEKADVSYLSPEEVGALLAAPDAGRWEGRRDRALMTLAAQTGLRLSELIGLNCGDVELGASPRVRCMGKGRKQRLVPLTAQTVAVLRVWLRERGGCLEDPCFPPAPADVSPMTPLNADSPYTRRLPRGIAHPWPRRTSPLTS